MAGESIPIPFMTYVEYAHELGEEPYVEPDVPDRESYPVPALHRTWKAAQALWSITQELVESREEFDRLLRVQTHQLDTVARVANAPQILKLLRSKARKIRADAMDFAVLGYPDCPEELDDHDGWLHYNGHGSEVDHGTSESTNTSEDEEDEAEAERNKEKAEVDDEKEKAQAGDSMGTGEGEDAKEKDTVKDVEDKNKAEDVKEKSKGEDSKENDQVAEKVEAEDIEGKDMGANVTEKVDVEQVEAENKAKDVKEHDRTKEVKEKNEPVEASRAAEEEIESEQRKTSASADAAGQDWECKTCQAKRKVREEEESDKLDRIARGLLASNKEGELLLTRMKQIEAEQKRTVAQQKIAEQITQEAKPVDAASETAKPEQNTGDRDEKIPAAEPHKTTQSDPLATARPKTEVNLKHKETSLAYGKDPHDAWYRLHNDIFALHRAMIQVNSEGYLARYTLPALPSYPTDRLPTTFVVEDTAGSSSTPPKQG